MLVRLVLMIVILTFMFLAYLKDLLIWNHSKG